MPNHRIPVWVKALDPLSQFGLVYALRQRPEITLLASGTSAGPVAIGLIAADSLDPIAVEALRAASRRGCRRTVLISGSLDRETVLAAARLGVSGVLRRSDATPDGIIRMIQSAAASRPHPRPAPFTEVAAGRVQTDLSDRETQVLRLVADGKDTQEIARELSYSERTVKSVLHDVTSRLQLRNRSHAVAYALRAGFI
ncbi:response regulator transcription factor [Kribbella deserti]|uniref:Response regulator transcription factor n=1 Tax=Kribbella deserti TaxID=1926257 RepID=A0ABV6QH26_9ACTN